MIEERILDNLMISALGTSKRRTSGSHDDVFYSIITEYHILTF
jgi:hypothetical protein